jgi:hypothetical protein
VAALQVFAQDRSLLSQMGQIGRQWSLANYAETKMLEATHKLYSEYLSAKGYRVTPPLPSELAVQFEMTQQLSHLAGHTGTQAARTAAAINQSAVHQPDVPQVKVTQYDK